MSAYIHWFQDMAFQMRWEYNIRMSVANEIIFMHNMKIQPRQEINFHMIDFISFHFSYKKSFNDQDFCTKTNNDEHIFRWVCFFLTHSLTNTHNADKLLLLVQNDTFLNFNLSFQRESKRIIILFLRLSTYLLIK